MLSHTAHYSRSGVLRTGAPIHQRGLSLVELMIGLAIGLMTVAVAMGALMASRSVTATVSDSSQLQQQSAYAFRIFAQQLRQAGSMRLNLAAQKPDSLDTSIGINDFVAFETKAKGFDPNQDILRGLDSPGDKEFALTVGYRNYQEKLHIANNSSTQLRNCLGESYEEDPPSNTRPDRKDRLLSHFTLRNSTLFCAGEDIAQPIVDNVANFQVRYLLQSSPHGSPQMRYVTAAAVGDQWNNVFAVEVCLVLFGNEVIDMPAESSYADCPAADGTVAMIDMTSLEQPRNRRVHKAYRSVFQLRSQGLLQAAS